MGYEQWTETQDPICLLSLANYVTVADSASAITSASSIPSQGWRSFCSGNSFGCGKALSGVQSQPKEGAAQTNIQTGHFPFVLF